MNKDEYDMEYNTLKHNFDVQVRQLLYQYAFSNNPYKEGDILEDHYQIIQVDKIKYTPCTSGSAHPSECVYIGQRLTKKLTPYKNNQVCTMFQSNVKKCHTTIGKGE